MSPKQFLPQLLKHCASVVFTTTPDQPKSEAARSRLFRLPSTARMSFCLLLIGGLGLASGWQFWQGRVHAAKSSATARKSGEQARRTLLPVTPTALSATTLASLTVTDPGDATVGAAGCFDGCSLREAITTAVAGDVIGFSSLFNSPQTITLTGGELLINKNLTINGPGVSLLTVSGNNVSRVFNIVAGSFNVTLSGLTIANGRVSGVSVQGGGILNNSTGTLNIINSRLMNNAAVGSGGSSKTARGGAIFNAGSGSVNVTSSTLDGNSATATGDSFNYADGGGILNDTGTLNVRNSTLSGNSATTSFGSGGGQANGGGIYNGSGTAYVTNSTLSANFAISRGGNSIIIGLGGAILTVGTLNLTNSTLTGNGAFAFGGSAPIIGAGEGGGVWSHTMANVKNTIIALNMANPAEGPDVFGAFTSQGYNLIGDNTLFSGLTNGVNNDQVGSAAMPLDPLLGPLQNNGGPTQTHRTLAGSPAIDKGAAATDPVTMTPIATDQRGFTRPVDNPNIANAPGGNGSDIGAYEEGCGEFTCPANISQTNDPGQCGAMVTYIPPVSSGCNVTCTPSSGSFFSVGTTTVNCTSSSGTTCSFTVTVNDTQAPVVTCPANIRKVATGAATVTYTTSTATDNCSGASVVSCNPPSGSSFPLGTTTITCNVSDAAGNSASCGFTVTVLTPQQAIQDCIAKVQMLVPPLNQGQANSLITKLNQAISSLDQDKTGTACNQLQAFINQVTDFINNGELTPAQGQMLIGCIIEARSALGCGS